MEEDTDQFRTVSTSILSVGTVLGAPIYDQHNTKLLGAGVEITEDLLARLEQRGIHSVVISRRDLARLHAYQPQGTAKHALPGRREVSCTLRSRVSIQLDARIDAAHDLRVPPSSDAFLRRVRKRASEPYSADDVTRFSSAHEKAVDDLEEIARFLLEKQTANVPKLQGISSEALDRAAEDLDLFVCLGANPYFTDFPTRHSLHVAGVAMAVAITMELDKTSILELGIGCLIHDVGMRLVRHRVYQQQRELTDNEFTEIAKHPLLTLELLEKELADLPPASVIVAYQLHERCDGGGYPHGYGQDKIHDLAKIAAVVVAYIALVSPRPHRPGLQPYYAVKALLSEVRDGLYEPAVVRALLRTISLFPVGSYVALDDEHVGKVIRTNPEQYDRPVLEVWRRSNMKAEPRVVDLADSPMRISRTLARLPRAH